MRSKTILFQPKLCFFRDAIRAVERRSLRSAELSVLNHGPHMTWFNVPDHEMSLFDPVVEELEKRSNGVGAASLLHHHIGEPTMNTRAQYFESTYMITTPMEIQLNHWLKRCPRSDYLERRCIRALANVYDTSLHRSSKDCKPLLKVHRDNVNDADLTLVVGITPTCEYRGSMLYVSNVVKDGRVWFNKEGSPSRKSVQGIDMCKGVCVVLKNNPEHYVSTLQSGKRGSLVFHMKVK